jgi:hypothetical protein
LRPPVSTKSHKWAANIEIIIRYTKLFLSFCLQFFPHLQSFDSLDTKNGKAGILKKLCEAEKPEPQRAFQRCADRQKHLRKGQYIEKDTDTQDNEARAERKSGKPRLGLPEKYSES